MTEEQTKGPPVQKINLASENSILHRQLDEANTGTKKLEAQLREAKQQLADSEAAKLRAEEQVTALQKQLKPDKKIEARIELDTKPANIEKLLEQGWISVHMQFSSDGKLQTVWKRENRIESGSPEDETTTTSESKTDDSDTDDGAVEVLPVLDPEVIADEIFKPLPGNEPIPQPVNAQGQPLVIEVISDIPQPQGMALGPIGTAIREHGLQKTKEAMDAMVQLRIVEAMGEYDPIEIKQFERMLPAEVQS